MDETVGREHIRVESVAAPVATTGEVLSWGSIWAGLLTAFGIFVLLSLTALAAGLDAAPFADPPENIDVMASIVTGLFVAVAFTAGGFVAAWTAVVTEPGRAILHGFLVWATYVLLLLLLVAAGLGGALGTATRVFAGEFTPEGAADLFTNAAWGTVFVLLLAMAAAILGALIATRDEVRAVRWRYF